MSKKFLVLASPMRIMMVGSIAQFSWNENLPIMLFDEDWVQSLEDTPDRYRSSQTKDIYLRTSLLRYLQGFEDSRDISTKPPSYSRDTIHKLVPTGDLLYLNVFDFGLEYVDWPELNLQWGRCDIDDSRKSILREIEAPEDSADTLWNWLIDSLSWADYPSPDTLPKKLKEKLQQDNCREEIFRNYHNRGIARLTDSVSHAEPHTVIESAK